MCICLTVKQQSNEALSLSLPAGVTLTKTQDLRHPVTFVYHWLHLWLMNNSRSDLCVDEVHKQTRTQSKRRCRHSTSCLITDQYFICSPSLFRRWLAFLPKGTAQGYTHTHIRTATLSYTPDTHIKTAWGGCSLWLTYWPCRTDTSLTLYPFQTHITVYQLLTTLRQAPHVSVCVCACVLKASGPSSLHTSFVSLLHHCLHI